MTSTRQEKRPSVSEELAVGLVQLCDESAPNTEVGLAFPGGTGSPGPG